MNNPCNKCRTRWLCEPYGGKCWRKKRYIKRISKVIADQAVSDFRNYWEDVLERLKWRVIDGN